MVDWPPVVLAAESLRAFCRLPLEMRRPGNDAKEESRGDGDEEGPGEGCLVDADAGHEGQGDGALVGEVEDGGEGEAEAEDGRRRWRGRGIR